MSLVSSNYLRSPQRPSNRLEFGTLTTYVITRIGNMTVIGAAHFDSILLNDVRTAALEDRVRRDDFNLMFVAFSKGSHFRNRRLPETGLMGSFEPDCGLRW